MRYPRNGICVKWRHLDKPKEMIFKNILNDDELIYDNKLSKHSACMKCRIIEKGKWDIHEMAYKWNADIWIPKLIFKNILNEDEWIYENKLSRK